MAIDWDNLVLGPAMRIFGEQVIYWPQSGSALEISDAVFDEAATEVAIGEDGQISTQFKPMLGVRASWFAAPPQQSDTVQIVRTGVTYVVKDVQADNHGHIRLALMVSSIG